MIDFGSRSRNDACPSGEELSRAVSDEEESGGVISTHIESCERCGVLARTLQRPRALARTLPWLPPTPARLEQTRTAVLAGIGRQPARPRLRARPIWGGVALLASLATATGAWALWPRREPSDDAKRLAQHFAAPDPLRTPHARLLPRSGARFQVLGDAADDVVRLREGSMSFDVSPLAAGERFRVVAGDGEVEVRGTFFETDVNNDRLAAVHVVHGRVEVRVGGKAVVVLGAGDSWVAGGSAALPEFRAPACQPPPPRTNDARSIRESASRDALRVRGARQRLTERLSPSEAAFVRGWSAFRTRRWAEAVTHFNQALRLDPAGPLAEDVRYWRAIALARAGATEAVDALGRFLRDYPGSPHAGSASVELGWRLLAAGRREEATRSFRDGLKARDRDAQRDARSGLAAVAALPAPDPIP